MNSYRSVVSTCIGILFLFGAIMGFIYFLNIVSNPWYTFEFGGCGSRNCNECEVLSVVFVGSIVTFIVGAILGTHGVIGLKKQQ